MAGFGTTSFRRTRAITRWRTAAISIPPSRWDSCRRRSRLSFSFTANRCSAFALQHMGTERCCRRRANASAWRRHSIRCRSGHAVRGAACRHGDLQSACVVAAADAHVSRWGSQNAWLRQITAENRLYVHRDTAAGLGLADDDWVWIESHHAKVKGQIRLVDGVNRNTVWTWNAIGKRRGAWMLDPNAPEGEHGFLLNHAISEFLPADAHGARRYNADPITGQAAWFDLRVRLRKCAPEEGAETAPQFPALATARRPAATAAPARLRCTVPRAPGGPAMTTLPAATREEARAGHRPRHLCRLPCLRDQLQGVEHRRPHGAAHRSQSLCGRRRRRVVQSHPHLRTDDGERQPHRAFSALVPALRGAGLRDGVSDRGLLQARIRRHRAGRSG